MSDTIMTVFVRLIHMLFCLQPRIWEMNSYTPNNIQTATTYNCSVYWQK